MTNFRIRPLTGFDDPSFGRKEWDRLLACSKVDHIYLTHDFQRAWWETLGHGRLLLLAAERAGETFALAPLYTDGGMVFFVGSAFDSDYLDFMGDVGDPEVLDALLETARDLVIDFLGFRFYFVSEETGSGERLRAAARRLGLAFYREDDMEAAVLDLEAEPGLGLKTANRRRLRKIQHGFERESPLEILHLTRGTEILPHLDDFFEQHVARWAETPTPSRFVEPGPRKLIRRYTELAGDSGRLRFCRIDWRGGPIAFHYGFSYRGRYFWGMPSFDPAVARKSPGQLMTRHLLLAAVEEGAHRFDFGTGTQDFKLRFASGTIAVHTWGLYPADPGGDT